MAHGWGLYFAKNLRIGNSYSRRLSKESTKIYLDGKNITADIQSLLEDTDVGSKLFYGESRVREQEIINGLSSFAKEIALEIEKEKRELKGLNPWTPEYSSLKETIKDDEMLHKEANEYLRKFFSKKITVKDEVKERYLLKVDIPNDNVLLREDAPFDK